MALIKEMNEIMEKLTNMEMDSNLEKEDVEAAEILMNLHAEGAYELRGLLKGCGGDIQKMAMVLINYNNRSDPEKEEINQYMKVIEQARKNSDAFLAQKMQEGLSKEEAMAALAPLREQSMARIAISRGQPQAAPAPPSAAPAPEPLSEQQLQELQGAGELSALANFRSRFPREAAGRGAPRGKAPMR